MQTIREISIDIETYSEVDLKQAGVYPYAEDSSFELLLFGYSVNCGPVEVIDVAGGEELPEEILTALTDPHVIKWAYNAQFERVCLSCWLRRHRPGYFRSYGAEGDTVRGYLDPASWRCSRVWGAYMGLPQSLKGIGAALKLDAQKLTEGAELIRFFCTPCRPTAKNGGRTRNLRSENAPGWVAFKAYNRRDVEVELAIKRRLAAYPVPDFIWEEYALDQEINDRGIRLDSDLVEAAIALDSRTKERLRARLQARTGLNNPASVQQLKGWLAENGVYTRSLDKEAVQALLPGVTGDVAEVLSYRQQLAKSSVSKYSAMQKAVCADGRARGCFSFYGASRTGRWSGRLIQLQNLPQNHMADLEEARALVRARDFDALEQRYENIPGVLSELIRTAFIPKEGYQFIVSDFSAIEARVLAYLAGEQWRLDAFAAGTDIYCASASQMFGVPVEKNGINSHLRQKGKIAELALGYGGSVGALTAMGALSMGLEEAELRPLVDAWRESNPNITAFWRAVDHAVKRAVICRTVSETHGFRFSWESGLLFISLPSGRRLCYVNPRLGTNRFGGDCITYESLSDGHWGRVESYGPKFVENIVQAVARDILAWAMRGLSHCRIVGHVHDELILECPRETPVQTVCAQMSQTPPWLPGLPLRAEGYACSFYRKA